MGAPSTKHDSRPNGWSPAAAASSAQRGSTSESNGHRAFVVCYLGSWDPRYEKARDLCAVLKLEGCQSLRFGVPNDEAISGHPLWGRGLGVYSAHVVPSSDWLEQHRRWNSVHRSHSDEDWRRLRHYVFTFHDEMLEALAADVQATVAPGPMHALVHSCLDRLWRDRD